MSQRTLTILGVVAGTIVTAALVAASIWPVINTVETGETPEYPDVRPQYYTAETDRVFDACQDSIVATEGWSIQSIDRRDLEIEATRTVSPFGFVFDVTIWVEPVTQHVTRVRLRSSSRTGQGDFGQNARNIRTFYARLDDRLGGVKLDPQRESGASPDASSNPDSGDTPDAASPPADETTDTGVADPDAGRPESDAASQEGDASNP